MAEKTDALATKQSTAIAANVPGALEPAPDYFKDDERTGFDGTTQSDLSIPRLALAQLLSPQVQEGTPNYIQGLKPGDLFNSVTGQIYGKEVYIQLLRRMPLRAMEFYSVDDGGGVKDPSVPLNDPRLKWGNSGNKKADKPKATLFRDFLAVILPQREMISLSFKSTGLTTAKTLWGLAVMRGKSVYAGRYRIFTGLETDPKPHYVYKAENAGWASEIDAVRGKADAKAVELITFEKIDAVTNDEDHAEAAFDAPAHDSEM